MARGRFLNTSISEDIALNSLSIESHWLYMMTIPHLDRDGLIKADTYVLFGKVCPRRPELIPRIDALIAEWVKEGLAIVYATRDGRVAFFKGFTKNQQGMHYAREAISPLDPPPGYIRTDAGLEPNHGDSGDPSSGTPRRPTPDEVPTNSGLTPPHVHAGAYPESQVKDQSQVKSQVEVKAEGQCEATAPADAAPQDDALDPKALIADLRSRQFVYLDKDATVIAAKLIADYGWPSVMEAANTVEARHKEKIAGGSSGITAPLAYMRSVLAGTASGNQQTRGNPLVPAQSMGEASVDKFLARYNGVNH